MSKNMNRKKIKSAGSDKRGAGLPPLPIEFYFTAVPFSETARRTCLSRSAAFLQIHFQLITLVVLSLFFFPKKSFALPLPEETSVTGPFSCAPDACYTTGTLRP